MSATRTFAVSLTIPDNEAFTALETLDRLGVPVARVVRADIWLFDADEARGRPRERDRLERDHPQPEQAPAGRAGLRPAGARRGMDRLARRSSGTPGCGAFDPRRAAIRRRTAWRLLDDSGRDVAPAALDRAVETFLCNPAFQVAIKT